MDTVSITDGSKKERRTELRMICLVALRDNYPVNVVLCSGEIRVDAVLCWNPYAELYTASVGSSIIATFREYAIRGIFENEVKI